MSWLCALHFLEHPSDYNCAGVGYEFAKLKHDFQGGKDGLGPRIGIIIVECGHLDTLRVHVLCCDIHCIETQQQVMAALLPEEKRQRRTRRNVIQLTGHCLKFGLKYVWRSVIGGPTAFISKRYLLELQLVSWIVIYGLTINLLQMVVSPILRRNFNSEIKLKSKLKKIILCLRCINKSRIAFSHSNKMVAEVKWHKSPQEEIPVVQIVIFGTINSLQMVFFPINPDKLGYGSLTI